MTDLPASLHHILTEVRADGMLAVRIEASAMPTLAPGELLLKVEAAPLHPTDLGQLLLAGDLSQARREGDALVMPIREQARAALAARAGQPMRVGTEGAGTIVAVGNPNDAHLVGRKAATFAGGLYADHRVLRIGDVKLLPDDIDARAGAAIWVNPMTALAMVETMRDDGAEAIAHTAAASSLGQILQRICAADDIPLVNIVRRPEQVALLREAGADHVLNSEDEEFRAQLIDALAETNATVAFDAIGGGTLIGTVLSAMDVAQLRRNPGAGFYGNATIKRGYVYGRLDMTPTTVPPTMGMAWNLAGFLLPHFLAKAGAATEERMMQRVLGELETTFAIHYSEEASLTGLLDPELLTRATAKATGAKVLVRPNA